MNDWLELNELGGDFAALLRAVRDGKSVSAFSLGRGGKIHVSSGLGRFVLYVTADRPAAGAVRERFSAYFGDRAVLVTDKDDVVINRSAYSEENTGIRIDALSRMIRGEADVAVIPAEALPQYFPDVERFKEGHVLLKREGEIAPEDLADRLSRFGYSRQETVHGRGIFASRGDIFDVWPLSFERPLRINFYGDLIESMRFFDPETGISSDEVSEASLPPSTDVLLTDEEALEIIERLKSVDAYGRAEEVIADVTGKLELDPRDNTLVWALPFFPRKSTILDYLPMDAVIVLDAPSIIYEKLSLIEKEHAGRIRSLSESGEALPIHIDSLMRKEACVAGMKRFTLVGFQLLSSSNPVFGPDVVLSFACSQPARYHLDRAALKADLKTFNIGGYRVALCCGDADRAAAVSRDLRDEGLNVLPGEDFEQSGMIASTLGIREGFIYHEARLVVLGTEDLFGRIVRETHVYRPKKIFERLKTGDFVVHEVHGIGICEGTEKIETAGVSKDYVVLRYRDGDRLYVPVDQTDLLTKFSGSEKPALNRIGGKEFARTKARARASARKMALDLYRLYGERAAEKGFRYSPDTVWQKEFEDGFPFDLTDDQIRAVRDVKRDMEAGKVMDRLICGDVGYGKTEVALRAVFKTVLDGKQAVILAPTTILAKQHYNTLLARTEGFGIRVRLLSRLQKASEIREALEGLADGSVSVAVGTHRILSGDVSFHDLGLLVLDEEQRFGVEHKEKLKAMKKNVNVLTLTATPIPRTLNLALSGVRDISLIDTPPRNRLPVQNYVTEYSDGLLKDAVGREIARGGQVFVLYNRVESIDAFAEKIRRLTDGKAKIMVAHGQMPAAVLDAKMTAFYQREADVLVSTTIIENGIDLPDANTLFVCDADRFGLSELYQLRGRVGRSGALAHAYFTTRLNKVLTGEAVKRLSALTEYSDFGGGFKISLRDLEIRGAGTFLGAEQHGHIEKVGFELYSKILAETVDEIKTGTVRSGTSVEMKVDADAYVDENYVNRGDKIRIYRQIAGVDSPAAADALVKTLTDIYGPPARPLLNLINIALLKSLCSRLGVARVIVNEKGAAFDLEEGGEFVRPELLDAAERNPGEAVLAATVPPRLIFRSKGLSPEEVLKKMIDFCVSA